MAQEARVISPCPWVRASLQPMGEILEIVLESLAADRCWKTETRQPEILADNGTPARANWSKGKLYVGKHKISRRMG